ncbi:hypothetical protein K3152_08395 [Qipengyuania sp. 1NDH17]|uniref:Uncharacterized protein n=1 Tax=Qipengyuania polymorpha TaxID=2867234 RepID=A0ABS7J0K5_9SPHN|nr:hypothetical protein [Qipengyuania polymorpha]MBX7458262.1 hypothetical protein [Qipengyuania polymorpha]
MRYAILPVFLLSACASVSDTPAPTVSADGTFVPAGATLNESGFISVTEVPALPYPESPPPEPDGIESFSTRLSKATPAEQEKLWEEANGTAAFQAEVQRLQQVLRVEEPDNFVQVKLLRDETAMVDPKTLLGAEVWFKRDAAETLARYTSRDDIFPRTGGLTQVELDRLQQVWIERFEGLKWSSAIGGNASRGVLEITPGVTRETFMAAAEERGWKWGDEVQFTFAPPAPPPFADSRVEDLIRIFPRAETAPAIQLLALGMGRVILDDGCFRFERDDDGDKGPLVMFGYQTQLGLDEEGFLIVTSTNQWETETYRIGEVGAWGGPNSAQEEWETVKTLRARCGEGQIVNIGTPQSLREFSLPASDWLADYAEAEGLGYQEAWDEVIACYRRQERLGRSGLEVRDRCIRQFN